MLKAGLTVSISILLATGCSQESDFSSANSKRDKQTQQANEDTNLENPDFDNTADGLGNTGDSENNRDIESLEDVKISCAGDTQTVTKRISFPNNNAQCPWEQGDNLKKNNGKMTARIEQNERIELPKNAIFCSTKFTSASTKTRYDDAMALALGPYMIFSTLEADFPSDKSGLNLYSWSSFAGKNLKNRNVCIGPCEIPVSEQRGNFSITVPDDKAEMISFALKNQSSISLKLITMGDDDRDKDCKHDQLDFDVTFLST